MRLFDTHAHFDGYAAEGVVPEVLGRATAAGVERICAIGGSAEANELAVRLAGEHPGLLLAAVGYDRDQADRPHDVEAMAAWLDRPGVVAVGEIGLDYFYGPGTAPRQRVLFGRMLEWALARRRPVVVHSREADADTLAMLGEFSTTWKNIFHSMEKTAESFPQRGKNGAEFSTAWKNIFHSVEKTAESFPQRGKREDLPPPGVLHCFTGGEAFAEELLGLGFMISFSGIVSFNNADALRAVARGIPADRLLVETDCPYLTPKPFRGKVNEPAYVAHVVAALAAARGEAPEDVAGHTRENARRLFQMEGI